MYIGKIMSSLNESIEYDIPPVIPLTQMEMKEDGTSIVKRVRPLTYALITFVKNIMNEPDTINISDDEMEGEWNYNFSIDDTVHNLFFNTYEEKELITLDVYVSTVDLELVDEASVNEFIVSFNLQLKIGQIQKLNNNSIRFHASIAVEGIASQEKDYSGPHLISPKLFANMFDYAVSEFPDIANAFVELQKLTD
jgi:hypothetical protein